VFACSSATHVHRCVDEGDCSTWHDVIECPDGFSCCGGLCIPGDSAVARCSMGRLVDPEISVPVGMGYWCSVDLANRVDSDLAWASVDPCADLKATHSGASIARAGLYSTRGTTAGLGYCGTTYTGVTYGVGDALLRQIRSDTFEVYADCHYLFSPVTMPIFQAPFPASEGDLARYHVQAHAGFDFAVTPKELDVSWFGPSSGLATIVDHYGQDRSSETQADDDDGRDWAMDAGTPIYAVASGRVVASRERVVARGPGCASSETRTESEIYVQHDVGHGSYRESFVTYYGHLQDRLVAQGSVVTGGALIGHAGHAGCAAEDGLHFAVTRLTNTIGWYQQTFTVDATETGDNGRPSRVEPFGWAAGDVDPWGWRYVEDGKGAWSPQLWKNENPPPDGRW
jgi:murein DD-endopeptidase MepM/ murein hydrolase activator NlpD